LATELARGKRERRLRSSQPDQGSTQ
jgi:hypothetical protein